MMPRITALGALGCSLVLLSACSSDPPQNNGAGGDGNGTAGGSDGGVSSGGGNQDGGANGQVDSGVTNGDAGPTSGRDAGATGTGCGTCSSGFSSRSRRHRVQERRRHPHFGQVYVILMENTSQSAIVGNTKAPYINSLFTSDAHTTAYSAVTNPSLPNYIALTSGDTQGITCDCHPGSAGTACTSSSCNLIASSCDCTKSVDHVGKQLDAKGLAWRIYGEDMGAPCNITDSGNYAARHIPFLYYDDVRTNAAYCKDHVVDYCAFAGDSRQIRVFVPHAEPVQRHARRHRLHRRQHAERRQLAQGQRPDCDRRAGFAKDASSSSCGTRAAPSPARPWDSSRTRR